MRKDYEREAREKHEEALAYLKEKKARHIVFGYAHSSSDDTSVDVYPQFAWDDRFRGISLPEHFHRGLTTYIYAFKSLWPNLWLQWGMHTLDIQLKTILLIGSVEYKKYTYSTPEREYEWDRPVFEFFPNYEEIYKLAYTDWRDESKLSHLYELAESEDMSIVQALAVNSTTPDYILAQLANESEDKSLLLTFLKQNPNCPDWL